MNKNRKFDEPVMLPDDDLLGAVPYAKKLAKFIENEVPPFTLGVYGEWGAGKTSFVRLIQHFLTFDNTKKKIASLGIKQLENIPDSQIEDLMVLGTLEEQQRLQREKFLAELLGNEWKLDGGQLKTIFDSVKTKPVEFIYFSAWPYTTSDNIWRALVLQITRSLFESASVSQKIPPGSEERPPATEPAKTFYEKLQRFLSSDMIVFNRPVPPPDPLDDYKKILSSLDHTGYGSISKDPELKIQFNQEIAITAIVDGALKAMGSISPLVKLFQGMFGIEFKPELSGAFQAEKNAATRKIVESIDDFRKLLYDIFCKRQDKTPVFVFIDDLDRCLPDVALDILEAIKIFLGDIPCVFMVAADDALVGQGLRLRYSELFKTIPESQIDSLLAVKGQEYFEKIIQFGVKVPSKTAEQTHSFISAQFPKWVPATDIIQTAVGTNPRRLKQYCNRLSYSFHVQELRYAIMDEINSEKQKKEERSRKTEVLDKIIRVYAWKSQCVAELRMLMDDLDAPDFKERMGQIEEWLLTITPESLQGQISIQACEVLCRIVSNNDSLMRIFKEPPVFSGMNYKWISTFSQFADISPGREGLLETSDATFMRIYNASSVSFSAKTMMIENIASLIDFFNLDQKLLQCRELFFELAEERQWSKGMKILENICADPNAFLNGIKENDDYPPQINKIIKRICEMQASDKQQELYIGLRKQIAKTPKPSTILAEEVLYFKKATAHNTPGHKKMLNANFKDVTEELKNHTEAQELYDEWEETVRDAVIESLELRFFAVEYFQLLRSIAKLDGLDYKWPVLARSTSIYGRLFLRELETTILDSSAPKNVVSSDNSYLNDETLKRFLSIRPLFKDIPESLINQYLAVSKISARVLTPEAQQPFPAATLAPVSPNDKPAFKLFEVVIGEVNNASDKLRLVKVKYNGKEESETISIDPDEILKKMEEVNFARHPASNFSVRQGDNFRGLDIQSTLKSMSPESFGLWLVERIFGKEKLIELFNTAFSSPENIRLVFQLQDDALFNIPFELLYLQNDGTFVSTAQRISVLRYLKPSKAPIEREFDSPAKILVAISRPKDVPYLEYDQERDIILYTLKEAEASKQVKVYIIDNASKEKLQQAFLVIQPHIFHFIGHGVQGSLVLEDEKTRNSELFNTDQLNDLLDSYKINMVILNACNTATIMESDVSTGIAGRLVKKGIPAVIASTKAIMDQAALMFTKQFYQVLIEGFSLEIAISEARKALKLEQLEWHPYILFTSTTALDNFKLKVTARREGEANQATVTSITR